MSSENDSALGFDRFNPDAHPDGSIDVLGSIRNLNTAEGNSHATRGEISNLLDDGDRDYQWIRYRCDSLAEADVLKINKVQTNDRVEKRYSVAEEYLDDARKIARTMSISGGEIPRDIGVNEFVDVAGALADAIERIDELEDAVDDIKSGLADADGVDDADNGYPQDEKALEAERKAARFYQDN